MLAFIAVFLKTYQKNKYVLESKIVDVCSIVLIKQWFSNFAPKEFISWLYSPNTLETGGLELNNRKTNPQRKGFLPEGRMRLLRQEIAAVHYTLTNAAKCLQSILYWWTLFLFFFLLCTTIFGCLRGFCLFVFCVLHYFLKLKLLVK